MILDFAAGLNFVEWPARGNAWAWDHARRVVSLRRAYAQDGVSPEWHELLMVWIPERTTSPSESGATGSAIRVRPRQLPLFGLNGVLFIRFACG